MQPQGVCGGAGHGEQQAGLHCRKLTGPVALMWYLQHHSGPILAQAEGTGQAWAAFPEVPATFQLLALVSNTLMGSISESLPSVGQASPNCLWQAHCEDVGVLGYQVPTALSLGSLILSDETQGRPTNPQPASSLLVPVPPVVGVEVEQLHFGCLGDRGGREGLKGGRKRRLFTSVSGLPGSTLYPE